LGADDETGDGRGQRRVPFELEVSYSLVQTDFVDSTHDLSAGGVFLRAERPFPIGTRLSLTFELPGRAKRIRAIGEVIRIVWGGRDHGREIPRGMALRFLDLSPQDREAIEDVVRRQSVK
jgi:type IV pilus assembly protein PilZ